MPNPPHLGKACTSSLKKRLGMERAPSVRRGLAPAEFHFYQFGLIEKIYTKDVLNGRG
jgi:hypothetical protein